MVAEAKQTRMAAAGVAVPVEELIDGSVEEKYPGFPG